MDFVAQLVLSSVVWGPVLVILYWVIRLAVRHGMEDAWEAERVALKRAAAHEAARQRGASYDGSEPE